MTEPHATYDKPNNTEKWRVMFTIANSVLVSGQDEARMVADLVNVAYLRGRSDVQRDLRRLLDVAKSEEWI